MKLKLKFGFLNAKSLAEFTILVRALIALGEQAMLDALGVIRILRSSRTLSLVEWIFRCESRSQYPAKLLPLPNQFYARQQKR